ncbi:MAG: DedA family protein [Dehalococcoidia bacterium]
MANLQHATRLFLDHYGLAALFILLTIEEAGLWLPLPGDLLIMYFGYQLTHTSSPLLRALPILAVITASVICGSLALYFVTRRFRGAIRKLGRFVHLDERRLASMERQLQRHGPIVIVPGRLVPGLRIPTTVVSGLFAVRLSMFVPSVAVAAILWGALYLVLGAAGRVLTETLQDILQAELTEWLAPAMLSLALLAVFLRWRHPRRDHGAY